MTETVACMQVARPVVSVATATAAVPDISAAVVACSVVVGITTSLILFCSHFHQIPDDIAANKISPLVRLGTANGVKVICCLQPSKPVSEPKLHTLVATFQADKWACFMFARVADS